MLYLGEQNTALELYSKQAICWLSVKIKGRRTNRNRMGHFCGDTSCMYCNGIGKRHSKLDISFTDLFTDDIIESLIKSKPEQLYGTFTMLKNQFLAIHGNTECRFKVNCKKLFVTSGYRKWFLKERINYSLAKELDRHTCTFCNREYIFTYENKKGGKGMVPQFDHWFSKGKFPLLALSFYNLIPSCATCNTIKSSEDLNLNDHLHPYVHQNIPNTYMFSYYANSVNNNKIILKPSGVNDKGFNTANKLNLPLIYEGHSERELQDLIDLKYKYSTNYLEILLKKTFGDLQISEKERIRLIFGIELEEKDMHKRIFNKFKTDILRELKIIE